MDFNFIYACMYLVKGAFFQEEKKLQLNVSTLRTSLGARVLDEIIGAKIFPLFNLVGGF